MVIKMLIYILKELVLKNFHKLKRFLRNGHINILELQNGYFNLFYQTIKIKKHLKALGL